MWRAGCHVGEALDLFHLTQGYSENQCVEAKSDLIWLILRKIYQNHATTYLAASEGSKLSVRKIIQANW